MAEWVEEALYRGVGLRVIVGSAIKYIVSNESRRRTNFARREPCEMRDRIYTMVIHICTYLPYTANDKYWGRLEDFVRPARSTVFRESFHDLFPKQKHPYTKFRFGI